MLERERLQEILEEMGMNNPVTYSKEIKNLECEIGDHTSERWMDTKTPTRQGLGCGSRPPSKQRGISRYSMCRASIAGP
jgi:hypothetical protein